MMDLVFVHGINQQGKSSASLKTEWSGHLRAGLDAQGIGTAIDPIVPFYGDLLFKRTNGVSSARVTPQGAGQSDSIDTAEAQFLAEALEELAQTTTSYDEATIDAYMNEMAEGEVEAQGWLPMHRRINAIVRFLEGVSPWHGDIAVKVLKQAHTYLRSPGVDDQVEAIVAPALKGGPRVVVAHSLGTIVCFRILRRLALEGNPAPVPLFVTLGSPLSLRTVRKTLGPKYLVPAGVDQWINAYDPDDFVSLGQGLTASTFAPGITNIGNVVNIPGDAHAIDGYLRDPKVALAIGQEI
ncbi:MAG: hypothetical protein AAFN04_14445 [Pseudomonadota bacterium]